MAPLTWINKAKQIPRATRMWVPLGRNCSIEAIRNINHVIFLVLPWWVWLRDVLDPDQCTETHIRALHAFPMWSSSEALTWTFQMFFLLRDVTQHGHETGKEQEEWIHARHRRRECFSMRSEVVVHSGEGGSGRESFNVKKVLLTIRTIERKWTQKLTAGQSQWSVQPQMEHLAKRERKVLRVRGEKSQQCLWTWQDRDHCTHKLTAPWLPAQDQASLLSSMELLTVGSC